MSVKRINGVQLEQMLRNGLANLRLQEAEINQLNVFPVPDGDTGTNLRMTLEHGLQTAQSSTAAGEYLKSLAAGMLLGARGNSGVILSQFFYGFAQELAKDTLIGPGELRSGLIRGYRVAYEAVIRPVEGTMLTVAREGIEHIRGQITRSSGIDVILSMYVAEMRKTLAQTPELLAVLKESGVVDSGGAGFILIFEGMLKYLRGEQLDDGEQPAAETAAPEGPDLSLFDENSAFVDGYCMEFILQLMNGKDYDRRFKLPAYIRALEKLGESIVCVQNEKRVKVHIHTKKPAIIIQYSQKYGEFLTFKLENMQLQHNERDRSLQPAEKPKPLALVAVVNGTGMRTLFEGLGADFVIDGGPTMNTSSREFVAAIEGLNAETVAILPNHKNVIPAAEQAAALVTGKSVAVIPTKSFAEGYFSIAMDIPDSTDVENRLNQLRRGREGVITLSETAASRDFSWHDLTCRKGEEIALRNGELCCVGTDWRTVILDALALIEDIDDRETCVVFRGSGVPEVDEETLAEAAAERFPLLELSFVDGGQEIYHWVLGVL